MFKIALGVIIAVVLMRAFTILLNFILSEIEFKKRREKFKRKSSYREAFILECSQDIVKTNPYAKSLDKAIKKIELTEKRNKEAIEKLSKMKTDVT